MGKCVIITLLLLFSVVLWGQSPQTHDVTNTEPLFRTNSSWSNGVGAGYWPTCTHADTPASQTVGCSGLTLYIGPGTAICSGKITYAGGTLTMANNTTNYVKLNTASSCVPSVSGSAFTSADAGLTIADVVTSGGVITVIHDDRTAFIQASAGATPACTTAVQGSLAVGPQTCAGEKELAGVVGNAATTNFRITPASDQTAQNLYSGPSSATFTNLDDENDLDWAWHGLGTLNKSNVGPGFSWGFAAVNEDSAPSFHFWRQGLRVGVVGGVSDSSHTGGTVVGSNVGHLAGCHMENHAQATECDGLTVQVNMGIATLTEETAGILVLEPTYNTGVVNHTLSPSNKGIRINDQRLAGAYGGAATDTYAWWYAYGPSFLDANSNLTIAGKIHDAAIPIYVNNAAALLGGLVAGDFYRTGGDPDLVSVVH